MKKFLNEFKEFINKGNAMDLAVGVIIGAAFKSIVDSFVNDIINPIIGIAFSVDFSQVAIQLGENVTLNIGNFISTVINFVLMAFVLFCFVKMVNGMKAKMEKPKVEEAPAEPKKSDELKALEEIIELLKEKQ